MAECGKVLMVTKPTPASKSSTALKKARRHTQHSEKHMADPLIMPDHYLLMLHP